MKKETGPKMIPSHAVFLRSILGWAAGGLVGTLGVLFAQAFDLSDMASAQITMGLAGLTGGFLHAYVIEAAGGTFRWKQGMILSVIWALGCIGGAMPLFLTSGTPLKMTILTFYSFAAAAALGGMATVHVMRSFSGRPTIDPVPCIFVWSFGFGLAAAAMDAIGAGLKTHLPPWFAWPAAFAVMAVVLGSASGYSALHWFRSEEEVRKVKDWIPAFAGMTKSGAGMTRRGTGKTKKNAGMTKKGRKHKGGDTFDTRAQAIAAGNGPERSRESDALYLVVLILLTQPFYLNDFANIYVKDWRPWLFIDYSSAKLLPLLVILWAIIAKKIPPAEFGLKTQPPVSFMAVFFVAALAGTFMDQNGYMVLQGSPGYPPLGSIPAISDPCWKWIDMTAGLLMVGIFEEIVFRGYMCAYISRFTKSPGIIVGISAIAFGLIHWSGGAHQVLVAGAIGAVFMMLYLRTRSLPAIMLAHFAVNFIDFAGVIPKELFRFL